MKEWTMGDAQDARRRTFDVADRMGWQVNEEDPDDDWVSLSSAVASIEKYESQLAQQTARVEAWHRWVVQDIRGRLFRLAGEGWTDREDLRAYFPGVEDVFDEVYPEWAARWAALQAQPEEAKKKP